VSLRKLKSFRGEQARSLPTPCGVIALPISVMRSLAVVKLGQSNILVSPPLVIFLGEKFGVS